MDKEQLTWIDLEASASSMFNIMGNNKELEFVENVWQKLSEQGLTTYSTPFECVKIKILYFALGVLYKDFCKIVYDKHNVIMYTDLLKLMKNKQII